MKSISLQKNTHNITYSGGYTLLFAVLISAVVLSVAISVLNISRKELTLTSSIRESGYAINAADAGYECAVYWDRNFSPSPFTHSATYSQSVGCSQGSAAPLSTVSEDASGSVGGNGPWKFYFYFQLYDTSNVATGRCVAVEVDKQIKSGTTYTDMYVQGYNIGWNPSGSSHGITGDCSAYSPKKVERELHASY